MLRGDAPHLLVVALDCGKGRLEKLGQRHAIAGHERQIPRYPQAKPADGPQNADENLIAPGDQGRRRVGTREQHPRGRFTVSRREGLVLDMDTQAAMLPGYLQQGVRAGARGPHVLVAADKSDSPMAKIEEVKGCRANSLAVIRKHGRRLEPGHLSIEQHERAIQGFQLCDRFRVGLVGKREDESIDPALTKQSKLCRIPVGRSLGVCDQHCVPGVIEYALGTERDLGVQGVGNIANQETDGPGGAAPQALGEDIRLVPQCPDGRMHTLPHRLAYVGMIRDHSGDRGNRDAGLFCDFPDSCLAWRPSAHDMHMDI